MYAKTINRFGKNTSITSAEVEAENFARDNGHAFVTIEKEYRGGYCAVFHAENDIEDEFAAAIVRCPHCEEVQVCWGEYGDPATENCICSKCNTPYQTEPF